MTLTQTQRGDVHVFSCEGELALGRGDHELPAAVGAALDAGARRLVLNFTRLAWLDSAGIGAVVACSKSAADRGAILHVVAAPDSRVRRILVATHLDHVFDIFDDVDSAVRSFGA